MRGHEQGDAHVPPDPTRRSYGHYHNRTTPLSASQAAMANQQRGWLKTYVDATATVPQ